MFYVESRIPSKGFYMPFVTIEGKMFLLWGIHDFYFVISQANKKSYILKNILFIFSILGFFLGVISYEALSDHPYPQK